MRQRTQFEAHHHSTLPGKPGLGVLGERYLCFNLLRRTITDFRPSYLLGPRQAGTLAATLHSQSVVGVQCKGTVKRRKGREKKAK